MAKSIRSVNSVPVETVTLDGMVDALGWSNVDIDILKVDVEGAEVGVFFGAKQLLIQSSPEYTYGGQPTFSS